MRGYAFHPASVRFSGCGAILLLSQTFGLFPANALRAGPLLGNEKAAVTANSKKIDPAAVAERVLNPRALTGNPILWSGIFAPRAVLPPLSKPTHESLGISDDPQVPFDKSFELVPYPFVPGIDPLNPLKGLQRVNREGWDVEPRADTIWGYDNNVNNDAANRKASSFATVGGGVQARLGSIRPSDDAGQPTTPYALAVDYDVSRDTFFDAPQFNATNQAFQLSGRAGRDTFIIRPILSLSDITSKPVLDVEREGRVERKTALGGTALDWNFNQLSYRGNVTASANQQPALGLIDFDRVETDHELGFVLDRTSRPYVYTAYRNNLPSTGSFGEEWESGVGFDYIDNDPIVGETRSLSRIGWAQLDYQENPAMRTLHSGLRFQTELSHYFTEKWEVVLTAGRFHLFDDYIPNAGRLENRAGVLVRWRPDQRWGYALSYALVLADPDQNDQYVTLHRVLGQATYRLFTYSFLFIRLGYEHGATDHVTDRDEVGFRESVGLEWRF